VLAEVLGTAMANDHVPAGEEGTVELVRARAAVAPVDGQGSGVGGAAAGGEPGGDEGGAVGESSEATTTNSVTSLRP